MRRGAVLAAVLGAVLVVAQGTAGGVDTYHGAIDDQDPTLEALQPTEGPGCGDDLGVAVHYDVVTLAPGPGGTYRFALTSTNESFAAMYVYEISFDPADPAQNCVASASFGDPVLLELDLVESMPHFVVVWDDTLDQVGGDYTLVVTPPPPTAEAPRTAEPPPASTAAPVAAPIAAHPAFTG